MKFYILHMCLYYTTNYLIYAHINLSVQYDLIYLARSQTNLYPI